MITPIQIRELKIARHFRPFVVRTSDDNLLVIATPESIACGPNQAAIYDSAGGLHFLDTHELEIVELPARAS